MNDTKKSTQGGKREGAGRKSIKEALGLSDLMTRAVTSDDWIEIFVALKGKAKRGDAVAAKLLLAYQFGEPDKRIEINGSEEAPLTVRIIRASTIRPDNQ
jgi:hypothetical protein